jgi:hypothetical protein
VNSLDLTGQAVVLLSSSSSAEASIEARTFRADATEGTTDWAVK